MDAMESKFDPFPGENINYKKPTSSKSVNRVTRLPVKLKGNIMFLYFVALCSKYTGNGF
jgi:hypothetical protein